jgi:seryl-tRNA synthetase
MLDIQLLRSQLDFVAERLATRGKVIDFTEFSELETRRKSLQTRTQELQNQRNTLSRQIGVLKGKGEDASAVFRQVADLKSGLPFRPELHLGG